MAVFGKWSSCSATLTHAAGLHARPSLAIVQTARRFQSQITVGNGRDTVDAKEVLQLLTLGAASGTELVIRAKGPDADAAVEALRTLVANNFGMED